MRFIHLFLVGYFVVVLTVAVILRQTGALSGVAPVWIGVGFLGFIGVGMMMLVSFGKPTATEPTQG
jgi:hypothetical protein